MNTTKDLKKLVEQVKYEITAKEHDQLKNLTNKVISANLQLITLCFNFIDGWGGSEDLHGELKRIFARILLNNFSTADLQSIKSIAKEIEMVNAAREQNF